MKRIIIAGFLLLETACGSPPDPSDHRYLAEYAGSIKKSPLVKSMADLPACTPEKLNHLIFVKELDVYKVCLSDSWSDVDTSSKSGQNLEPAKPMAEAKQLLAADIDICSDLMPMACFFDGGQFITYQDGTIKYQARIVKKIVSQVAEDQGQVNSSDSQSQSMVHLPAWPNSSVLLLSGVSRNTVTSDVWLYFDAKVKEFSLIFDTNKDHQVSEGDEFLFHPIVADF